MTELMYSIIQYYINELKYSAGGIKRTLLIHFKTLPYDLKPCALRPEPWAVIGDYHHENPRISSQRIV